MNACKLGMGLLLLGMLVSGVMAVEIGQPAPPMLAKDQDGKVWNLSEHLGNKHVVIYFYPAAMTGGCTKQACAYRDYRKDGNQAFEVVGVSGDSVENLKWFQQAENLNFTLLSDADGAMAKAFGVPVTEGEKSITRSVDGKEVVLTRSATTARWTFIVDPKGTIVYRADSVKPMADLESVLGFLEGRK